MTKQLVTRTTVALIAGLLSSLALAAAGSGFDLDGDGIDDEVDNCHLVANAAQTNRDGDLLGDACDHDNDNDGLLDGEEDLDADGTVDPGETDPFDRDSDGDGYDDGMEVTHGSDALDGTSRPAHNDPALDACLADTPTLIAPLLSSDPAVLALDARRSRLASTQDYVVVGAFTEVELFSDLDTETVGDLFLDAHITMPGPISAMSPVTDKNVDNLAEPHLYVVTFDGEVEAWEPQGSLEEPLWSKDIDRTGGCSDRVLAAPVVQIRITSSDAFQARYSSDLVYVGTAYDSSCSDAEEDNRIVAYDARDGTIEWSFNSLRSYDVDRVHGLTLDQPDDVLFATVEETDSTQDSLWAIDVLLGQPIWSANVGSLFAPAMLAGDRVYTANTLGQVVALDKGTGSVIWTTGNDGSPILEESKILETAAGVVWIANIDIDGKVWMLRDEGVFGVVGWQAALPAGTAGTALAFGLGGEHLFVGADDDRIYQLDVDTGAIEAIRHVGPARRVRQLAIQQDDTSTRPPALILTAAPVDGRTLGATLSFCQPFRTNTSPIDTDDDGVTDGADNCPGLANPRQGDIDQDGIGDACDPLMPFHLTLGGSLEGLAEGATVLLEDHSSALADGNGSEVLVLAANGPFTFEVFLFSSLVTGPLPYEVDVLVQPDTPGQTCTVFNASGRVGSEDIGDLSVACVTDPLFADGFESGGTSAWSRSRQ